MKKQLLIAAVAATMGTAAIADVSITGNGKFEYFHTEVTASATNNGSSDTTNTEVNLSVVGKTGDTTVVANIEINNDGSDSSGAIDVEDLYISTKIGDVSIKGGNFASGTTALGGEMDQGGRATNKVSLSTVVGPATISYAAAARSEDASSTGASALDADGASFAISMPIAGYTVQVKEQSDSYTMFGISGDVAGFGIRYEAKDSDTADQDESFGYITKSVEGIDLGFAWYDADSDSINDEDDSAIFAVENAGNGDSNQQISASTTIDGNKVTVKAGSIGFKAAGTNDRDYTQISASRSLASGATLALTYTDKDTANTTDTDESFGYITKSVEGIDLGFAWYASDADQLNDEDDSAIFAVENNSTGDSNQQISASTTIDGNKITVKAGSIGFKTAGTNDRDYAQIAASRSLASGATLALTYTDKDTGNATDEQKFEADISVKF
jgi:hypothetical protein